MLILIKFKFKCNTNTHNEQISLDIDFLNSMIDLHKRVNSKEVVVGWYATGEEITYTSALIHEAMKKYVQTPFHLLVDTTLSGSTLSFKGYLGHDVAYGDKNLITRFEETHTELHSYEAEKIVGKHKYASVILISPSTNI